MKAHKLIFIIFCLIFNTQNWVFAEEECSRSAIINGQEVLIDNSSNQKGEGLRFYLEKDEIASKYLEKYQDGTGVNWINTVTGTAGTLFILSEIFSNASKDNSKRLILTGTSLLIINFLVARTFQATNEANLIRAIEEYNQRNTPRIEYPIEERRLNQDPNSDSFSVYLGKTWSF